MTICNLAFNKSVKQRSERLENYNYIADQANISYFYPIKVHIK